MLPRTPQKQKQKQKQQPNKQQQTLLQPSDHLRCSKPSAGHTTEHMETPIETPQRWEALSPFILSPPPTRKMAWPRRDHLVTSTRAPKLPLNDSGKACNPALFPTPSAHPFGEYAHRTRDDLVVAPVAKHATETTSTLINDLPKTHGATSKRPRLSLNGAAFGPFVPPRQADIARPMDTGAHTDEHTRVSSAPRHHARTKTIPPLLLRGSDAPLASSSLPERSFFRRVVPSMESPQPSDASTAGFSNGAIITTSIRPTPGAEKMRTTTTNATPAHGHDDGRGQWNNLKLPTRYPQPRPHAAGKTLVKVANDDDAAHTGDHPLVFAPSELPTFPAL